MLDHSNGPVNDDGPVSESAGDVQTWPDMTLDGGLRGQGSEGMVKELALTQPGCVARGDLGAMASSKH